MPDLNNNKHKNKNKNTNTTTTNNIIERSIQSVLLENLLVCQANYLTPLSQYIKFCINKALGTLICTYVTPWETEHLLNNKLPGNRTSEVPTSQAPFLSWHIHTKLPYVHTMHPAHGRKNKLPNKQLD